MNNTNDSRKSGLRRWSASTLAVILLGPMAGTMAQDISWSPLTMTFPDTPIYTTSVQTLTITNMDGALPLTINNIEWTWNQPGINSGLPQYEFEADRHIPTTLLPGESMEIEIRFTPEEAFTFASANMLVTNTSPNAASLNYWVDGMGVENDICFPLVDCSGTCTDLQNDVNNCGICGNSCPTPANASALCESSNCGFLCNAGFEPLDDECIPIGTSIVGLTNLLINYWNAALEEPPTITGFGPGNSAVHHRDAIENMLLKARDYIFAGVYDYACGQLGSAYLKTDGGYPFVLPPDFVAGEGVSGLNERIVAVIEELDELLPDGCPLPEPTTKPRRNQ
jgi:hypothetical protein